MTRLVLLAALLVACSKKPTADGPPCEKVVDHMLDLTKQMLPGHGDQPLGDRKAMIDQCVQRKMPAAMRSCLLDAKSLEELAKCRSSEKRSLPAAPPGAQPGAQPPAPEPAPAPTQMPEPAPAPTPDTTPTPTPTRPLPTGSAAPGSAG